VSSLTLPASAPPTRDLRFQSWSLDHPDRTPLPSLVCSISFLAASSAQRSVFQVPSSKRRACCRGVLEDSWLLEAGADQHHWRVTVSRSGKGRSTGAQHTADRGRESWQGSNLARPAACSCSCSSHADDRRGDRSGQQLANAGSRLPC
jgi:hypothetical protein